MTISLSRRAVIASWVVVNMLLLITMIALAQLREDRQRPDSLRQLGASEYPQPIPVAQFSLTDRYGQPFDSGRLLDKWSLVFFGFTSCSDICPLTISALANVLNELAEPKRQQLQVLFVSVDPDRDSPEVIGRYLDSFHEDIIGLTGDIELLASQLYVVINNAPRPHEQHAQDMPVHTGQIDHSSHLSLIGPGGNLRAVLRPPHRARDIIAALEYFLD